MTFIFLIASHFICDTVLQPPHVSQGKNPDYAKAQGFNQTTWPYFMLGHAFTHATGVYLVTGKYSNFITELVMHFLIDWLKIKGFYGNKNNMHIDQLMHVLCKVIYVL